LPPAKSLLFNPVNGLARSAHGDREPLRNIVDATGLSAGQNQQYIECPERNARCIAQASVDRVPQLGFESDEVIENLKEY
jgi:hypothetical protein